MELSNFIMFGVFNSLKIKFFPKAVSAGVVFAPVGGGAGSAEASIPNGFPS